MSAKSAEIAAIPRAMNTNTVPVREERGSAATSALSRGTVFGIASLAAHAMLLLILNTRPPAPAARAPMTVTLEIPPPPTTQPLPAPAVVARPDSPRPPAPRRPSPARPPTPLAPPASAASASASTADPVDMTGVTLTAGAGAGWASPVGDGSAMTGPIVFAHARRVSPPAARAEVPLVPLADLSRRPEPPELAANLERLYPAEARRTGTAGEALVSGRVRPDGTLDRLRVVRTTQLPFAQACLQLLTGSRWSPPLDRTGTPCATEIRYTCRFQTHD